MRETKRIGKYLDKYTYCIMMPVYYEHEEKPCWRIPIVGSKEYVESRFNDYPDYEKATQEENREMRKARFQEYMYLKSVGRRKADCQKIKEMYGFN